MSEQIRLIYKQFSWSLQGRKRAITLYPVSIESWSYNTKQEQQLIDLY